MKTLNFSSPPEIRIIGSHGEDHDDGGQVQGGGEGGAAVPAEEHRHRPFTGLLVLRREIRSEASLSIRWQIITKDTKQ